MDFAQELMRWEEGKKAHPDGQMTADTLEEGLEIVKAMADALRARVQRCVVINVCGLPNAGKSKLINRFGQRYGALKQDHINVTSTHDPQQSEAWEEGMKGEYFFIHTPNNTATAILDALLCEKKVDVVVFLYNPRIGHLLTDYMKAIADVIICNKASFPKPGTKQDA